MLGMPGIAGIAGIAGILIGTPCSKEGTPNACQPPLSPSLFATSFMLSPYCGVYVLSPRMRDCHDSEPAPEFDAVCVFVFDCCTAGGDCCRCTSAAETYPPCTGIPCL